MIEPKVWTFFYGSYINLNVLKEVNFVPEQKTVESLLEPVLGFGSEPCPRRVAS